MISCWLPMMGVHASSIIHSWLHYNHPGSNMFMISHELPMMGVHAASVTSGWSCYDYYGGNLSVINRGSLMTHELLLDSIEQHIQAKKKRWNFISVLDELFILYQKCHLKICVFFSLLYVDVKNYKIKLFFSTFCLHFFINSVFYLF